MTRKVASRRPPAAMNLFNSSRSPTITTNNSAVDSRLDESTFPRLTSSASLVKFAINHSTAMFGSLTTRKKEQTPCTLFLISPRFSNHGPTHLALTTSAVDKVALVSPARCNFFVSERIVSLSPASTARTTPSLALACFSRELVMYPNLRRRGFRQSNARAPALFFK
ncbi:unnamed protein product [Chondrus crispus]|uniref:Uncharacterized protein n=1 Tax=Chondrus crispus TaxID=2769 RepID=R7QE42_CHOCR|nr:unnamed protein product [Chondrus crispus]CDF36787.1 unnamed protein product [Chondrus crispus]|eukprot:XP_005716606.1 unnamed protein product [Chondrus crispus]